MGGLKQVGIDVDVNRIVEQHRRSFSESVNDILRRILPLVPLAAAPAAPSCDAAAPAAPGTRSRGQWTVEIQGQRIPAPNLKSAYRTLLEALSERFPDFLTDFSREKGRSRRFVARSPGDLYGASPHLARKHAEPLHDGWYFDTNLSEAQVVSRARIAARLCKLHYGVDLRLLEKLREV